MIWFISILMSFALAKGTHRKAKAKTKAQPVAVKMTKVATCKPELPAFKSTPAPATTAATDADVSGAVAASAPGTVPGIVPVVAPPPLNKTVLVFKQWHLAPTTVTKGFKEKYGQEKNQTAIYKTLSEMVKKKQLEIVVAEGCEGEIDGTFETPFNGWTMSELEKQAQTKNFDKIITLVPMKVEARWGDKVVTLCGDDEKLIKESQMHLSNLRGWMGFYSRLGAVAGSGASGGDEKAKQYADAAADLLKVSKETPVEELKKLINQRSLEELSLFQQALDDRNAAFVRAVQSRPFTTAAIVIGGLHAGDLQAKLEKAGLACEIFEPPGYSKEDETVIQDFKNALKN